MVIAQANREPPSDGPERDGSRDSSSSVPRDPPCWQAFILLLAPRAHIATTRWQAMA